MTSKRGRAKLRAYPSALVEDIEIMLSFASQNNFKERYYRSRRYRLTINVKKYFVDSL